VIVGAGPAGSTTAFYLRRYGIKVLLLERKKFPRDKYCGDAVSFIAQKYLKEMGVFDELQRDKLIRMVITHFCCFFTLIVSFLVFFWSLVLFWI
jgi:flavin-dependent dehydrogenase